MNPGQRPVIAQIVQILANGLRRDLKTPGKILHHYPAEGAGDIEDLGLAMSKAGHICTSDKNVPYGAAVPASGSTRQIGPKAGPAAERQILVKAACTGN